MEFKHKPVLLEETIQGLNIKPNGIYVDGTLGGAGHSKEILKQLSPEGSLIGIDRDEDALKAAKENLKDFANVKYIHGNHDEIEEILENPQKFNIPNWMLNRREDYETGENIHLIESDLDMTLRDDLNRMKKTRSYKGRRHEAGLPVRGQRTKSTFRNSSSVGVKRS